MQATPPSPDGPTCSIGIAFYRIKNSPDVSGLHWVLVVSGASYFSSRNDLIVLEWGIDAPVRSCIKGDMTKYRGPTFEWTGIVHISTCSASVGQLLQLLDDTTTEYKVHPCDNRSSTNQKLTVQLLDWLETNNVTSSTPFNTVDEYREHILERMAGYIGKPPSTAIPLFQDCLHMGVPGMRYQTEPHKIVPRRR